MSAWWEVVALIVWADFMAIITLLGVRLNKVLYQLSGKTVQPTSTRWSSKIRRDWGPTNRTPTIGRDSTRGRLESCRRAWPGTQRRPTPSRRPSAPPDRRLRDQHQEQAGFLAAVLPEKRCFAVERLVLLLDRVMPGPLCADLGPQAPGKRFWLCLDRLLEPAELRSHPVALAGPQVVRLEPRA